MKKSIFLTVLLGLFCVSMAFAVEPGDTLWTRTYGGASAEWGTSVQQTSDGGYIVAGGTLSFGAGNTDVYLVRTDANGAILWTRTYGGSGLDQGNSTQQTTDGGYIVAGNTWSFGAGESDVYLVKTDANGDTLWTRTYGGRSNDFGNSVQQTADGGYIVAGWTMSFGAGHFDVCLVKTDSLGNMVWTRTYGGRELDVGNWVHQTTDGGYIIAGGTYSFGAGGEDFYLVKTDPFGNTLWTVTEGGQDDDYAYSVQQTDDLGYIVAGWTKSFGPGDRDFYLVKTDASGDTLWTRTYGGSATDDAYSVQQTTDGGYIIAGETASFGAGSYDVYLVKTDWNGDTLWTRTYGGNDPDYGYCVQQTNDGGYIIAGETRSFGSGTYDAWLLRIAGGEVWVSMECQGLTPVVCRGKNFYFSVSVNNHTAGNISGTLSFRGYAGYDCDPANVLVVFPRSMTYPPGVTEQYYFFKVPNVVTPGQYSSSVSGTLDPGGHDVFCCMNTDIIECGPFRTGGSTEWALEQVDRPEAGLPTTTALHQNYPNPFNATTVISYVLPSETHVKLEVYNLFGEKVATLVDGRQEAGHKSIAWDASQLCSGLYFYKLVAGDYTETKRTILIK